jgi:hypothetical protein
VRGKDKSWREEELKRSSQGFDSSDLYHLRNGVLSEMSSGRWALVVDRNWEDESVGME